jgi:UDP-galactose transporter B1
MGIAQLLVGAGGIYAAFLYYGSLQEDVLTYKDASGQKFAFPWLLQVLEATANVVLGFLLMAFLEGTRFGAIGTAGIQVPYLISGALQVSAKYCTTYSMIAGVSFPVATLGKSSKMVPVMIGQLLLGSAKYSIREYIHVALIVGGTAAVSLSGKSKKGESSGLGLFFLAAALACDGIVGGTQKRLKAALKEKNMKERNFEMQFLTNFYMAITAVIFMFALGEFGPGAEFLQKNPGIFIEILKFSACSAAGQAFIFYTISTFDPLVCTTVTTTRKVFSVLLSIFTKGHAMNHVGWGGIAAACGGILGELQQKASQSTKKKDEGTKKKDDKKKK